MSERIRIFVGAYGSGKTEVALQQAFIWAAEGKRAAIADLDLVNPFFRSRELVQQLQEAGVRLLAPGGELASADLPIITPQVKGAIQDPATHLVLDVGGDDAGSRALARFAPFIQPIPHQVYMVLNDRRPWTGDTRGIAETIERVQEAARLAVTALVSNPNLGDETTAAGVAQGHETIVRAGRDLGIPVAFLTVERELALQLSPDLLHDVPVRTLRRLLFPPWYQDSTRFAPPRDQRSRVMQEQIRATQAGEQGDPNPAS